MSAAADLLAALVRAGAEGRAAVDARIAAAMAEAGATVETIPYVPADVPLVGEFAAASVAAAGEERLVVGRVAGAGGGRSLLLFAHPDTEPPEAARGWSRDPFAPAVDGGRMTGWGVADDHAGVVMMIAAVAALRASGREPAGDVTLVSAPSKRHRRGIAAALAGGLAADAAIYCHPAESGRGLDEIKAFAPGELQLRITVRGRLPDTAEPAHTAFAHVAVNPLDAALPVIAALRALDRRRGETVRHPRLEAAIGRSANLMISGVSLGDPAVPSRLGEVLTLTGAMTLVPGEDLAAAMAEVEAAVAAAADADPWLAAHPPVVEWLAGVSGAETADDHPLYRTVAAALAAAGATPKVNPLHTSSDIRNPIVQRAIPTVGFGPLAGGLAMAGGRDEWVDLADLDRAIDATAAIVAEWCGCVATGRGG